MRGLIGAWVSKPALALGALPQGAVSSNPAVAAHARQRSSRARSVAAAQGLSGTVRDTARGIPAIAPSTGISVPVATGEGVAVVVEAAATPQ